MILEYNLQFFAKEGPGGEKTEPATQKKLEDARKEGQVAKSREIANGVGLLALFLVLKFWVGIMANQFLGVFETIYRAIPDTVVFWYGDIPKVDIWRLFRQTILQMVLIMGPLLLVGFFISFLCDVAQVGWKPTAKPLMPKLNKLNPLSGFKRIFSTNSLMELGKSIAKIGLIGYISYTYIRDKWHFLYEIYDMTLMQAIRFLGNIVTDLGMRISVVVLLIALVDLIYQRVKFSNDMKMTKQEVKDEYKQSEGDPQIKGKIRQRMQEASRRRMMQELPKADVVITNPTHYAVAIQYDPDVAEAPIVLAKGADYLAMRIREIARENQVEIVENKPLARMLYANVDIGQMVPQELYQAVAEVLAFVYKLKGKV